MPEVSLPGSDVHPDLMPQFVLARKALRSTAIASIVASLVFIVGFFVMQRPGSDSMLIALVYFAMPVGLFSSVRTIVSSLALKRLRAASRLFEASVICAIEVEMRALPFSPGVTEVRVVRPSDILSGNKGWMNFLSSEPVKEGEPRFFVETKAVTVTGRVDGTSMLLLSVENDTIHLCRKY
ncbi:MAG: hypothetical protein C0508_04920 [Cyanobacteria bacterium PR.023]|nr:hypothetical protein [Cyanobacteria bacterium PR.023]